MTRAEIDTGMAKSNAIVLLIDSLRYDSVSDPASLRAIAPNLAKIAERGFTQRVIANAQSTQFVMPSLFSQSYPLDHGGYNNGIRDRPASYVECLASAGYQSHLIGACNQIGITLGYDRGFDVVHSAVDYRHILNYRIDKTLRYELELVSLGEKSEDEALSVIAPELDRILEAIESDIAISDPQSWPRRLKTVNARVARLCAAERNLLRESPGTVLNKLRTLPSAVYWRCLGKASFGRLDRFRWRAAESINWRFRNLALKFGFPVFPLGHFQVLAGDLCPKICEMVTRFRQPWFMYIHFMDVHDSASLSRPWHLLCRLKYFPRWQKARRAKQTARTFLYDSALMYVDAKFGQLMTAIEKNGQLDDTIVLVAGDHGFAAAHSPREKKKELGHRTHYEDIDVGLVVSHGKQRERNDGLLDSMGVSATLLDILEIAPHASFKGKSAFGAGRRAVISENAGRGNADVARRDLFFTVTTHDYKLMATLKASEISCQELYSLQDDPDELRNLIDEPDMQDTVKSLLAALFAERRELLESRGAAMPTEAVA